MLLYFDAVIITWVVVKTSGRRVTLIRSEYVCYGLMSCRCCWCWLDAARDNIEQDTWPRSLAVFIYRKPCRRSFSRGATREEIKKEKKKKTKMEA